MDDYIEQLRQLQLQQRDQLLSQSDWVISAAAEQYRKVPADWLAYRQALRDLPANPRWPSTHVWPTQPAAPDWQQLPLVVSMRAARLALLAAGRLADVTAAIAAIPDATARQAAQVEWDSAREVHQDSAFVQQLGAALGLDDAGLDALFAQAVML